MTEVQQYFRDSEGFPVCRANWYMEHLHDERLKGMTTYELLNSLKIDVENEDKITVARMIAYAMHTFIDKNDSYYIEHLKQVEEIAFLEFGNNFETDDLEDMIAAALLHDVLEDCGLTSTDLAPYVSQTTLSIVCALTDDEGDSRKVRKANMFDRITESGNYAIFLKVTDRIANYRRCVKNEYLGKITMYRAEHHEFYQRLSKHGSYTPSIFDLLEKEFHKLNLTFIKLQRKETVKQEVLIYQKMKKIASNLEEHADLDISSILTEDEFSNIVQNIALANV